MLVCVYYFSGPECQQEISFHIPVLCGGNLTKRSLKNTISCIEDGRFYRNPERPVHKMWSNAECSKYYLCLEGEVFEFKCSVGLLFDVTRQICDFKSNVDNCDITAGQYYVLSLLHSTSPLTFISASHFLFRRAVSLDRLSKKKFHTLSWYQTKFHPRRLFTNSKFCHLKFKIWLNPSKKFNIERTQQT